MRAVLAALALSAAVPALGSVTDVVRRGTLPLTVHVSGVVVPDDVFRLKSTIDGRVESVLTSSFSWRGADRPLAFLAHKELAAMIDARGSQDQKIMEGRWESEVKPTAVRCPGQCFVLKIFTRPGAWVKPQAVLFEASRRLKLVGRVRPEDVPQVRDGQNFTFWALKDPAKRYTGRVTKFILDIQGENVSPGGTFTLLLGPERYFDPGTEWEGEIVPGELHDALYVPTGSLISREDGIYLPVRVSTGATTREFTQIIVGVEERREILILGDAEIKGAARYVKQPDKAAVEERRRELSGVPAEESREKDAPPRVMPTAPADAPKQRQPSTIEEKDYGDDPYGEQ